jgi:hypothetical protein
VNGTRQIAQRIVNAEEGFIQIIRDKGFTRDEAIKVMETMLRLKLAKLDPVMGCVNVKHGALLESEVIRGIVESRVSKKPQRRRGNGSIRVTGDCTESL